MNNQENTKRPFVNNNCIWCWACVAICWEVFDFLPEWLVKAKKLDKYNQSCINDAISSCPVDAISWIEQK